MVFVFSRMIKALHKMKELKEATGKDALHDAAIQKLIKENEREMKKMKRDSPVTFPDSKTRNSTKQELRDEGNRP